MCAATENVTESEWNGLKGQVNELSEQLETMNRRDVRRVAFARGGWIVLVVLWALFGWWVKTSIKTPAENKKAIAAFEKLFEGHSKQISTEFRNHSDDRDIHAAYLDRKDQFIPRPEFQYILSTLNAQREARNTVVDRQFEELKQRSVRQEEKLDRIIDKLTSP